MRKHIKNVSVAKWSGGTTSELYLYPENGNYKERKFDFRISTATVELEESEFTKLPGINRLIMSLDNPLDLYHNEVHIHLEPLEVNRFKGDYDTRSEGCVTDFNVMFTDRYDAKMKAETTDGLLKINAWHGFYAYDSEIYIIIDDEEYLIQHKEMFIIDEVCEVSVKGDYIHIEIEEKEG